MTRSRIYTDGSCLGNPGPGGWAWAINRDFYNSGHEPHTTNQRMELKACIQALDSHPVERVTIVSDSAYVVNCFEEKWFDGWSSQGFKLRTGDPVINFDLWETLLDQVWSHPEEVFFEKVKGHSGDPMNEFVDGLARSGAEHERQQAHRGRGHRHR